MTARPSATTAVRGARRARGLASLVLVMVWLLAATLVVLYASRALVFEQRTAANQVRAATAFEAAEAGLDWGLALLNHPGAVDAQCRAGGPSPGRPAHALWLRKDEASGALWPGPASAGCRHEGATAWSCSCPDTGPPAGSDPPAASAFALRVETTGAADRFRLVATGCMNGSPPCGRGEGDARAETSLLVAAVPLLAKPPAAALTARRAVQLQGAVQIANADITTGGVTVASGAGVQHGAEVVLESLPGRPATASVRSHDRLLGDSASLLPAVLGVPARAFGELPLVQRVDCAGGCGAPQLLAAWAGGQHPVLWVAGALDLQAGLSLGSPQAPVLLVVDGPLRVQGGVDITGLVAARAIAWTHAGPGPARLQGALLADDAAALSGPVQLRFDGAVLQRLRELRAFVRVPGGWHDLDR